MRIDHGKLSAILGSEIAGTTIQRYQWRPATKDDIGRLARFADRRGDDWSYGMLTGVDLINVDTLNAADTFNCTQMDRDEPEQFFICEVQEVFA